MHTGEVVTSVEELEGLPEIESKEDSLNQK